TKLVVFHSQIVGRRGMVRIRALPQLQRLKILLQFSGYVIVVTRSNKESFALADSITQLVCFLRSFGSKVKQPAVVIHRCHASISECEITVYFRRAFEKWNSFQQLAI